MSLISLGNCSSVWLRDLHPLVGTAAFPWPAYTRRRTCHLLFLQQPLALLCLQYFSCLAESHGPGRPLSACAINFWMYTFGKDVLTWYRPYRSRWTRAAMLYWSSKVSWVALRKILISFFNHLVFFSTCSLSWRHCSVFPCLPHPLDDSTAEHSLQARSDNDNKKLPVLLGNSVA